MATQFIGTESETRENRLGSITGYTGTLQDLGGQAACGGPAEGKRCFRQASLCNAACALSQLGFITDAAVVHHAPSGCAVTSMAIHNEKSQLAARIKRDIRNSAYVCTDMDESDTVFGAVDNLEAVVRETVSRYRPKAVFIGASCVSGVIGEDLESTAAALHEELGIPVAPVHCEGFRTQIWASGFDAAFHAILNHVVKPPRKKTHVVNVINFFGSARKEITSLFAELGVEPLFLLANANVEELSRLSESVATVSTCGTLGSYLGNGLQTLYGVPYVKSLQPHGIAGFESWLRGLGEVLGKQVEVERILARERGRHLPGIEAAKAKLVGLRAVVGMGPGFNWNTSRVLQELGIEIVHSAAWHFDRQYDDNRSPDAFDWLVRHSPYDYPLSVNDLQNHEILNILHATKPDIFFSRHTGSTVWAMKLGIPALCVYDEYDMFGYAGLKRFAWSIIDTVTNRSYTENLSKRVKIPYTSWWLAQEHDSLMGGEER